MVSLDYHINKTNKKAVLSQRGPGDAPVNFEISKSTAASHSFHRGGTAFELNNNVNHGKIKV